MPDAITTLSAISRRAVLGGILPGAALSFDNVKPITGAAGAMPALPCPDLPLIQADCRAQIVDLAIDGLWRRYGAAEEDPPEPELTALENEWGKAFELLTSCPARTMEGLAAKASVYQRLTDDVLRELLADAIAKDVLAIGRLGSAAV